MSGDLSAYLNRVADSLAAAPADRKSGYITMRPSSRDLLVQDLRSAAKALAAREVQS